MHASLVLPGPNHRRTIIWREEDNVECFERAGTTKTDGDQTNAGRYLPEKRAGVVKFVLLTRMAVPAQCKVPFFRCAGHLCPGRGIDVGDIATQATLCSQDYTNQFSVFEKRESDVCSAMDTGNGYRGRIPFAPLQLTFEEQERCHEATLQMLDRMLRDYDERDAATSRSPRHHSKLGSSRWKRVKTQHNASLYCGRGIQNFRAAGGRWESPAALLAVGTIQGSLDDVMLGLATQSFSDIQLKAASLASQDLRGAMLAKLLGPTEEDPFKCLSVVWMVGEQKWPLNMLVCPRDFVNLSVSGVITRANGDRIGYDLMQPAQLPQLPALQKPMVRGKLMYGALYREQNGSVDVYVKLYVDAMGSVMNTIVMNAMSLVALGFGKAQLLSDEKKLEWCVLNSMMHPRTTQNSTCAGRSLCSSCLATFTRRRRSENLRFGSTHVCAVCTSVLCSKCRIKRSLKITTGRSRGATTRSIPVVVCQNCLKLVYQQRAGEIAWQQYQHRLQYSVTDTCCSDRPVWGLVDETLMFAWSPDHHFSISDVFLNYSNGEGVCERSIIPRN